MGLKKVLMIVGIVFLVLMVVLAGVAFYFYNFYVFKTVRICVGEARDLGVPCEVVEDCIDAARENGYDFDFEGLPDFIQEKFGEVLDEVGYCNETCWLKDVRGIDVDLQELEFLDSCEDWEMEIAIEIRGKEGLEILKYLKSREE